MLEYGSNPIINIAANRDYILYFSCSNIPVLVVKIATIHEFTKFNNSCTYPYPINNV